MAAARRPSTRVADNGSSAPAPTRMLLSVGVGGDGAYGALDPEELSWKTDRMMREQNEASQGNSSTYDLLHSDERTGNLCSIDGINFPSSLSYHTPVSPNRPDDP